MTDREELLGIIRSQSYEKREVILTSGLKSDFYVDCKMTTTDPRGALLVGKIIFEEIKDLNLEGVGGMTMGADPIATSVALISSIEGNPLRAFFVRKEQKKHGKKLWIEGGYGLKKGSRVAVVEDVVTTGGSTIKSVERIKEAGFVIEKIISIVDREEGGRELVQGMGYEYRSLFTKKEIVGT